MKPTKKSNSAEGQGGGSSARKAKHQPLLSLAPDGTPLPSSALAQEEGQSTYTPTGSQPLTRGSNNVLTVENASTIQNSTLSGTLNWALALLIRRGLVDFLVVRNENGEVVRYQAGFPVSAWKIDGSKLVLK